ncbi:MAG TPA: J domain-containing protein [Polyangiaceae bacterium]
MRRRTRSRTARRAGTPQEPGLCIAEPSDRLPTLQRERERLLRSIASKKTLLDRLTRETREIQDRLATGTRPLLEEHRQLSADAHALFAVLLSGAGRPSDRKRRQIQHVYDCLLDDGVIGPKPTEDEPFEPGEPGEPGPFEPFEAGDPPPSARRAGGYSAPRSAGGSGHESLRDVFRRLAVALHPDRVRDEDEKLARTAAMKEITVAYEAGDVARLLEIERNHGRSGGGDAAWGDLDRQCATLESLIAELHKQLRALSREARVLRRSGPIATVEGYRQRSRREDADGVQEMLAEFEQEIAEVREVVAFVRSFHDKKISLRTFLDGPHSMQSPLEDVSVEEALEWLLGGPDSRRARPSRARRRTTNSDIPF